MDEQKAAGAGPLDLAAQLVSVAVAVLGATGYVLVLGATVLWLRLRDARLPTEIPLSIASRQELIVMGAQALALWLLLGAIVLVLAVWRIRADGRQQQVGMLAFGLGFLLALAAHLAVTTHVGWLPWALAAPALLLVAGGAVLYRPPVQLMGALLLGLAGATLVWSVFNLADEHHWRTLAGASGLIVLVFFGVPALHARRLRREANEAALAQLEDERRRLLETPGAVPGDPATIDALIAQLRLQVGAGAATRGRSVRSSLRWIALALLLLFLLGGLTLAAQLDRRHDFRGIVLTLKNGRCLRGTYLSRDGERIVLAGTRPRRAVVIPASAVRTSQLSGARTSVRDVAVVACAPRDEVLSAPGGGRATPPAAGAAR